MVYSSEFNHQRVLSSISDYQSSILEEFMLTAKDLSKEMERVCSKGIDYQLHVCFVDLMCERYSFYTVLNKPAILNLKNLLDNISNFNDPIELFRKSVVDDNLYIDLLNFNSFSILDSLANEYHLSEKAKELIVRSKSKKTTS